ncbi:hypothetical protein NP233_g4021 [Leucocoprinus birnbaumii]|uniref:RNase H type-1 domain-containing protein n=1 Tax=Leucocoprinus birnbaumii TaxID=56174 RepID=A0AAD5VVF4_9AGAR|nr:hypothetical protein NP233_g4021 [Leucocoprinus birnbaumii]
MENLDGSIVDGMHAGAAQEHAKVIFQGMFKKVHPSKVPTKFTKFNNNQNNYFYCKMYKHYPELCYCCDHWKANKLGGAQYSTWFCKIFQSQKKEGKQKRHSNSNDGSSNSEDSESESDSEGSKDKSSEVEVVRGKGKGKAPAQPKSHRKKICKSPDDDEKQFFMDSDISFGNNISGDFGGSSGGTPESQTSASNSVKPQPNVSSSIKPQVNTSSSIKPSVNTSGSVEPSVNVSSSVEPSVNVSSSVEPSVNVSSSVEPLVNASSLIKPLVNVSGSVKPQPNASSSVEPQVNTSDSIEPSVNASDSIKPSVNASNFSQHRTSPTGRCEALMGLIPVHLHLRKLASQATYQVMTLSRTHPIQSLMGRHDAPGAHVHWWHINNLGTKAFLVTKSMAVDVAGKLPHLMEAFDADSNEARPSNWIMDAFSNRISFHPRPNGASADEQITLLGVTLLKAKGKEHLAIVVCDSSVPQDSTIQALAVARVWIGDCMVRQTCQASGRATAPDAELHAIWAGISMATAIAGIDHIHVFTDHLPSAEQVVNLRIHSGQWRSLEVCTRLQSWLGADPARRISFISVNSKLKWSIHQNVHDDNIKCKVDDNSQVPQVPTEIIPKKRYLSPVKRTVVIGTASHEELLDTGNKAYCKLLKALHNSCKNCNTLQRHVEVTEQRTWELQDQWWGLWEAHNAIVLKMIEHLRDNNLSINPHTDPDDTKKPSTAQVGSSTKRGKKQPEMEDSNAADEETEDKEPEDKLTVDEAVVALWDENGKLFDPAGMRGVRESMHKMGETGHGIHLADDVNTVMNGAVTNVWSEICEDMPWFWDVKALIGCCPNMVPTGLGNNTMGYDVSILGVAKEAVELSDAPEKMMTSGAEDLGVGGDIEEDEVLSEMGPPDVLSALSSIDGSFNKVDTAIEDLDQKFLDDENLLEGVSDDHSDVEKTTTGRKRKAINKEKPSDVRKPKSKAP